MKAAISSPVNGSVLPGASVTFNWAGGAGPSAYWLYLGTKGEGSDDLYNSGSTTATSATVSGLPTTGAMVYAKFLQHIDGAWQTTYYTYWGGTPSAATLTTPIAGMALCGSTSFTWPTDTGPSAYMLELGTIGAGSNNLYSSGSTTGGSEKVTVPCDAVTVWVTLLSRLNGAWQTEAYTFTEGGTLVKAAITSPANKSVLPGSSVMFNWAGGAGPSGYWLYLGTTGQGSSNLYNSGATTATSATVTGLPTNGKTVYAELLQRINGAWQASYYTYTAQ